MSEKQTCPRRMTDWGPWEREEELDNWKGKGGLVGQKGRRCSFCGSMHPDQFMQHLRDGAVLGPTDKNYKAYLHAPITDEMVAQAKKRWLGGTQADIIRTALRNEGSDGAAIGQALEKHWVDYERKNIYTEDIGKFYYQHLSQEQRQEFIDMLNDKTMYIGYPGYIYVRPFFIAPPDPSPAA